MIALGYSAGYRNDGHYNIFIGEEAGRNHDGGDDNIFLGYRSGYENESGEGNIFLGYKAGYNETGDNKLYIHNSGSTSPLIYGEFDNDYLKINGELEVTDEVEINGNLGIGNNNGNEKLEVTGNMLIRNATNNSALILSSSSSGYGVDPELVIQAAETGNGNDAPFHISRNAKYQTSDNSYQYIDTGGDQASKIEFDHDGDIMFSSAAASTGEITFTDNMIIKEGGYVGIGTTSPGTNLDINGTIKIQGGSPGDGKVLTSDANGLASWEDAVVDTDTDDQTLSLSGTSLTIADGNTVDLATIDADEQTLSLSGDTLSISGGNSIRLATIDTNTDEQTLSFSGSTLSRAMIASSAFRIIP